MRVHVPAPEACAIANVATNESLQGWQSGATYLLSAGTPAASWHGRQLPFLSKCHHVLPGHCRANNNGKSMKIIKTDH